LIQESSQRTVEFTGSNGDASTRVYAEFHGKTYKGKQACRRPPRGWQNTLLSGAEKIPKVVLGPDRFRHLSQGYRYCIGGTVCAMGADGATSARRRRRAATARRSAPRW